MLREFYKLLVKYVFFLRMRNSLLQIFPLHN